MPSAPVALFIFNRPGLTRRVFERIRQARPTELLVVADGPRPDVPEDAQTTAAAREIVDNVDWPCRVHRQFSPQNLGCGQRFATGLTWVFDQVPRAIILEDDTLPHQDFFPWCSRMLELYEHDDRVLSVCGRNELVLWPELKDTDHFLCRRFNSWGWAAWARTLECFDFTMESFDRTTVLDKLIQLFDDPMHAGHLEWLLAQNAGKILDTWDVQWTLSLLMHQGLVATSRCNLVANLGFLPDATHTSMTDDWRGQMRSDPVPNWLNAKASHPLESTELDYDRAFFLLEMLVTYRNVAVLRLWERLRRRNPGQRFAGMPETVDILLDPLRHPGETLSLIQHLCRHIPNNALLNVLERAFTKIIAAGGNA